MQHKCIEYYAFKYSFIIFTKAKIGSHINYPNLYVKWVSQLYVLLFMTPRKSVNPITRFVWSKNHF